MRQELSPLKLGDMTAFGNSIAYFSRCSRNPGVLSRGYKSTSRKALGFLAVAAIALAGCSASKVQPDLSCELATAQICLSAAEAQLHDGTLTIAYSSRPDEPQVVPFVVPVFRQDGVLAAAVDCYARHRFSNLLSSSLGPCDPPESEESVNFLRNRNLCADEGSYAGNQRSRVETASTSINGSVLESIR